MQKIFLNLFILMIFSISQAFATHKCSEGSLNVSCWDCSRTDIESDCTAKLQDGVLVISGTGPMRDYGDYQNNPALSNPWVGRDDIHEVIVEEGITSLGGNAFEGARMSKVSLPSSLTNIRYEAFQRANNLEYLVIPDNVVQLGSYINLHKANNLKAIVIGNSVDRILQSFTLPSGTVIYCNESERRTKTCEELMEEYNPGSSKKIQPYLITDNGLIMVGNKSYASLEDLAEGKYIPKRIYTISEANEVSGKKNTVMIRYK